MAIELVHTYSLIHDDLPAMDDDDERRGKPSCHKQFDEATAILAGDGLLTFAFELLADESTHRQASVRCELIKALAKASGSHGMLGGQMIDLLSDNQDLTINEIIHLQRLKTGALFSIACESGAILGGASSHLRNLLKVFAYDIGLSFQITDDLLDAKSVTQGDDKRQDKSAGKPTFITALGSEKAKQQAELLTKQAMDHLKTFGSKADMLRELADYLLCRQY